MICGPSEAFISLALPFGAVLGASNGGKGFLNVWPQSEHL